MGQKLPNIHRLINKTMNVCESYLTKTYLIVSGASSRRCIGTLRLFDKVKWGGGITTISPSFPFPSLPVDLLIIIIICTRNMSSIFLHSREIIGLAAVSQWGPPAGSLNQRFQCRICSSLFHHSTARFPSDLARREIITYECVPLNHPK